MAARTDFNGAGKKVRGVIYGSLVAEGDSRELADKHGLLEKPMVRWEDQIFMRLRKEGVRTTDTVEKVAGKKMCIVNAITNVGSARAQRAVQNLKRNGPHVYIDVLQTLVSGKSRQYLKDSSIVDLGASPPPYQQALTLVGLE